MTPAREMQETLYHWARPSRGGDFEPAAVDYRNGKPYEVWFPGMDTQFSADQCEIAEQIIRHGSAARAKD